jgi:recombination protein RecR
LNEPYERLVQSLKALPGLGYRSAEKIALHLLVEKPERTEDLIERISTARQELGPCRICGNLTDNEECEICTSEDREDARICIVETVTDLFAMEKAGVFRGKYHILMGKLAPVRGIGPENLNIESLQQRLKNSDVEEVILALSNDMEGEATCHFLKNEVLNNSNMQVTRIGFGLPSGGGITYADENTLLNALQSRKRIDS